jgi:glycosyltransferase involved in cell wall biosynthesis
MLSIVIPSWKDPLIHPTIDSLLDEARGEVEIIPVLDGYVPDRPFRDDPRIKPLYLERNLGMRGAINAGVNVARGEYLMRVDEHQQFSTGYDVVLTATCKSNWIVTPRRYALDPVRWTVMEDVPPVDYMKLKIVHYGRGEKFSGVNWDRPERAHLTVDATMAMQGSCWVMPHAWWDRVIVALQSEGYGTHYQDSHEMVFKTWQAGGHLMVNKAAWHAHKHRKFPRTHSYGGHLADASFAYSLSVWRDYYERIVRPAWGI